MERSSPANGILNLGGGEIVLILGLLSILALVALGFFGLIYLIVRAVMDRRQSALSTMPSPLEMQKQRQRDRDQVQLLSILHFVFAGLAVFGLGFLCLHYALMQAAFANPDIWKSQHQNAPPQAFLDMFIWIYVFAGFVMVVALLLNLLSGIFLWSKRHRLFSLVIAALDCLQIPLGTTLGVFTIIVLSRQSVQELYCGQPETAVGTPRTC